MKKKRHVAVVIDLDWPLAHHQHTFAGIHRYAIERGNWTCSINPFFDLPAGKNGGAVYDGVVGRITRRIAREAKGARLPLVNVWMNSPAEGVPCVLHDATEAGRMAARHLLARGFRNFGFMGFVRDRVSNSQLAGFQELLQKAKFPVTDCWVSRLHSQDRSSWQSFQKTLKGWIAGWSPPIAVLATTDLLARYIAEACREANLQVPNDVALVGSANEIAICSSPEPSLSSIDFGFERIGFRAAEILDRLMEGGAAPSEPEFLAPPQLIVRQSSGAFAVDHSVVTDALTYIAENLHESLSLEQIADLVATTPRTLSRLFQKSLGRTVHQLVTHLRLERVKRELVETDDLLKTIATRCGFRDAIQLCKVFQREEKLTPSEYRTFYRS